MTTCAHAFRVDMCKIHQHVGHLDKSCRKKVPFTTAQPVFSQMHLATELFSSENKPGHLGSMEHTLRTTSLYHGVLGSGEGGDGVGGSDAAAF